jgi:hypothetical protein
MTKTQEYGVSKPGGRQGALLDGLRPLPGSMPTASRRLARRWLQRRNSALTCQSGGLSAIATADDGLADNYGIIEDAHQACMYQLAQHILKSRMPVKAVVTSTFSGRGPKCVSRSIC